ncbi:MAG: hypothetical protein HC871_08240 [Rhizobiales bacterium]|nr:hypothetical protein [Hyphomicrobiales bacterium]
MLIPASTATPQTIERSLAATPPAGAVRESAANDPAAGSTATAPQLVKAAQPAQAPARTETESRPEVQTSARQDRPGSRVNLLV